MQLSDEEVDLIRGSFRALTRRSDVAAMLYDRLFAIAPQVRSRFPASMDEQCAKFMSMLGTIVSQLHDHETLLPIVQDLGRRHVGYGTRPDDYVAVGDALLWTLSRSLGESYTASVRGAWEKAYAALTAAMLEKRESSDPPVATG